MSRSTKSSPGSASKIIKSGQEQAVASWANYLNQLRLDRLVDNLRQQDVNLLDALLSADDALNRIRQVVISNRGGLKGMHGFIAEIAETGIGNARSQIVGGPKIYQLVDDNGPIDIMRGEVAIQQKFSVAGGSFGLGAIADHLERYPDFIESGHRYQIPNDHYEIVRKLYAMPPEDARKFLARSGDGPSFSNWKRVQSFFDDGSVPFESLEPSHLDYREVQQGTYSTTFEAEKKSLRETNQDQRYSAYQESKPTVKQGTQVALGASMIEGTTTFVMAVSVKLRAGKKLADFDADDWAEVANETGLGFAKGGVRGFSIYTLTNFAETSSAAASSIVTAAFGIAEQANRLRRGDINEQEFIENAELVSLEAAVSALSSSLGSAIIPVPVLGAVIGNTVGILMYKAVSNSLSKREAELVEGYLSAQQEFNERLDAEYQDLISQLDTAMSTYLDLLEVAFSPDLEMALDGSVALALELGVAYEDVLDSEEKTTAYFVN